MSDVVTRQYEEWVYPLPIEDMEAAIQAGSYGEIGDPAVYWPLFWPARRGAGVLDILVAGCGTNQAAYYACRHRDSRVVGVDVSDSSLEHADRLKRKHGLDNLTLVKMDLVDVGELGADFDFITTTGVLHHLPDPVAGLAALRSVLRPEGVINVMVYGTSLRLGVYLMQDLFRTLGLEQTTEDVGLVRSIIGSLPEDHAARKYLRVAPDLEYDAGVVDTFLHGRERSYYVTEVYDLAHEAGLEFLSWCDPLEYSLVSHVPPRHPAWPKLRGLSERDAAHACDLLTQTRGTHRFALAHPEYVAEHRIPFETHEFLDCSVTLHPDVIVTTESDPSRSSNARCERRGFTFELDYRLQRLLAAMANGARSLGAALDLLELADAERDEHLAAVRSGFASLRSQGHVVVLLPERPSR